MTTESVRPENRYTFHCGAVQAAVPYIGCVLNKHRFWRGERVSNPVCAAAMRCGGCPAVRMINLEWQMNAAIFFDEDSKPHRLPERILEQVRKIVFYQGALQGLHPIDMNRLANGPEWGQSGPDEKPKRLVTKASQRAIARNATPLEEDDFDHLFETRSHVTKAYTATPSYRDEPETRTHTPKPKTGIVSDGFAENIQGSMADALNEASAT